MSIPIIFKIGLKENLIKQEITDGAIYLTEDTCELFFDKGTERKQWLPGVDCIQHEVEEEIDGWEEID